jgi:hypothetical protein
VEEENSGIVGVVWRGSCEGWWMMEARYLEPAATPYIPISQIRTASIRKARRLKKEGEENTKKKKSPSAPSF